LCIFCGGHLLRRARFRHTSSLASTTGSEAINRSVARVTDAKPLIHVIDEDPAVRESLCKLLTTHGYRVIAYGLAADYLAGTPRAGDLVLVDVRAPEMSGIDLLDHIRTRRLPVPVVLMSAYADIKLAVRAIKSGAADFIVKPFDERDVLASLASAAAGAQRAGHLEEKQPTGTLAGLTTRESEVLAGLLEGKLNKAIAFELGISVRTVDKYRANLMMKTKARSLSELIQIAVRAEEERDKHASHAGEAPDDRRRPAAEPLIPEHSGKSEA
jgi:two-component system response regulator FixJ